MPRRIPHLRWWIGGILFASTVINYIDRQALSLLAPYLKQDYRWSNSDYANIVIAFRMAYSLGQAIFGRLMDRMGGRTRFLSDDEEPVIVTALRERFPEHVPAFLISLHGRC
jgi:sugar phosphate permease